MRSIPPQTSFVVVGFFESVVSGIVFSRREWPAHVTLAANFAIDGPVADIVSAARCAGALTEPLVVQFAGSARFGPHRDIPVQLVQPARVSAVHSRLADRLEPLPGFVAEQPAYWRNGYRPHLTLSSTITAEEGASRSVCCVAVAQLLEDTAMIVAGFDIPEN